MILPILQNEFCHKRQWLEEQDLVDFFALSQCLPGVIAVNVSAFSGYKIRGKTGAVISVLGTITAPFLAIIMLACVINQFIDKPVVQNIFFGIGLGVIVLVFLALKDIWRTSIADRFSFILFLIIFLTLMLARISPAIIIILAAIIGISYKKFEMRVKK